MLSGRSVLAGHVLFHFMCVSFLFCSFIFLFYFVCSVFVLFLLLFIFWRGGGVGGVAGQLFRGGEIPLSNTYAEGWAPGALQRITLRGLGIIEMIGPPYKGPNHAAVGTLDGP